MQVWRRWPSCRPRARGDRECVDSASFQAAAEELSCAGTCRERADLRDGGWTISVSAEEGRAAGEENGGVPPNADSRGWEVGGRLDGASFQSLRRTGCTL